MWSRRSAMERYPLPRNRICLFSTVTVYGLVKGIDIRLNKSYALKLKSSGRPDTGLSGRIPDNAGHRTVRRPVSGIFSGTGHVRRPVSGHDLKAGHVRRPVSGRDVKTGQIYILV